MEIERALQVIGLPQALITAALSIFDKPLHAPIVDVSIIQVIALAVCHRYEGVVSQCLHALAQALRLFGYQGVHGVMVPAVQVGQQRAVEVDYG